MKAAILREFGPPSVLRLEDMPTPTPGPENVLIQVATVSVALNAVRDVACVRLGLPSIELAKAAGASVITMTRSQAKVPALREAGADHVVVAASGADFSADVLELTNGAGGDAVIEGVGSRVFTPVFTPVFKSLAMAGRYAFVGQLMKEQISINPARSFFRRAQLQDAIRLVAAGKIHPLVAALLPLTEAAHAHALVEAGDIVSRVVLQP